MGSFESLSKFLYIRFTFKAFSVTCKIITISGKKILNLGKKSSREGLKMRSYGKRFPLVVDENLRHFVWSLSCEDSSWRLI